MDDGEGQAVDVFAVPAQTKAVLTEADCVSSSADAGMLLEARLRDEGGGGVCLGGKDADVLAVALGGGSWPPARLGEAAADGARGVLVKGELSGDSRCGEGAGDRPHGQGARRAHARF